MTLEEQQKLSAANAAYDLSRYESVQEIIAFNDGFSKGAGWADTYPYWHKYTEKRPSETQPSNKKYYAACYDAHNKKSYTDCFEWNGREFGRYKDIPIYDRNHEKVVSVQHEWESYSHDIIAWMELPEPPKFD